MNLANCYERLIADPSFSFVVIPIEMDDDVELADEYEPLLVLPDWKPFRIGGKVHVVSTSANPLHDAHRAIFDKISGPVSRSEWLWKKQPEISRVYELSVERYQKEPLSYDELKRRLKQFIYYAPIWVTRASLFIEKAGLLPQNTLAFHVGMDTAKRIVEHHGLIATQGIRATFYAYPRANQTGEVEYLHSVMGKIPDNMIQAEHPAPHLIGLSSTQIRSQNH